MASRINIGPEDGPYVAINESSGNLQLEDNSGNVVAEWDEANAQWDFANNTLSNVDALNSNSVNTDGASVNLTGADATQEALISFPSEATDTADFADSTQFTSSVGTTATRILDPLAGASSTAIVLVSGHDGDGNRFWDILQHSRLSSPKIINEDTVNSPATRSYSRDGGGLNLAMGSDSYDVRARSVGLGGGF